MRFHLRQIATLLFLGICLMRSEADTRTVFQDRFFSRNPEMNAQRAAQTQAILKIITAAADGKSANRFGQPSDGVSLGLFILDPDNVTTTSVFAIAVLRNQTVEPVNFWAGLDEDILAFGAFGTGNQSVERTTRGQYFGGTVLLRNGMPAPRERIRQTKVTLEADTQIVYEINIGSLFNFEPGKEVVLTAIGRLRDARYNVIREIRSENVIVIPKEKNSKPSLFDGPHIPAEYMKYATNPPIRNDPPSNPGDAIKTRLPHPPSQPPVVAYPVKTAPSRVEVGKGGTAAIKVDEPPPLAGPDHVENPAGSSQTKYFLAGTVLALLVVGGLLLRRR